MAKWAKLSNDGTQILEVTGRSLDPERTLTAPVNGKPYWVPVVEESDDRSTGPDRVIEPPEDVIEAGRVVRKRVIRDKTKAEKDEEDLKVVDDILFSDSILRTLAGWIMETENRLRALEGKPEIDINGFRSILKDRVRKNVGE